jgi:hypothetical protein
MNGAEAWAIVEAANDQEAVSPASDAEVSSKSIASIDDLAELLLTTTATKRLLIAFGGLVGSEPTDHATVLAERLLARHGTELSVRKILDAALQAEGIDALAKVVWEGHEGSYVLAHQGEEPGSLRAAVPCLTTLVTAHLEKGEKGVDSVASSTPLLKTVRRNNAEKRRLPRTITDRHTQALIELVSTSTADDVFVMLEEDLVAMPSRAANAIVAQWQGWLHVVKDRGFNVEQSVAATPCLPPGARDVVAAHLRKMTPIRLLDGSDAPAIANVAHCISRMPENEAKQAAQRLHAVFFLEQHASVNDLLMACLGHLLNLSEAP